MPHNMALVRTRRCSGAHIRASCDGAPHSSTLAVMSRTLRSLAKEVFSAGYFTRARQRAQRRKSAWNLVLIPLVAAAVGGTTYVLFQVMWHIHTAIYPAHIGRLGEFWGRNIAFGSFVSSFLLLIPLFFA